MFIKLELLLIIEKIVELYWVKDVVRDIGLVFFRVKIKVIDELEFILIVVFGYLLFSLENIDLVSFIFKGIKV